MYSLKRLHLDIFETINDGSEQLYEDGEVDGNFEAKCGEIKKTFTTPVDQYHLFG